LKTSADEAVLGEKKRRSFVKKGTWEGGEGCPIRNDAAGEVRGKYEPQGRKLFDVRVSKGSLLQEKQAEKDLMGWT